MVSINDYEKPDGSTDWERYRAAQVAAGEMCYECGAYIFTLRNTGRRLCSQCQKIQSGAAEVAHDKFVVCPSCRHKWSPWDSGDYDLLREDEHDVTCPTCEKDFTVETMVSHTFRSKPKED